MPRKKPAPKRLDDEEQRAAVFVMGETDNVEETAENIQINKALTESLTNASAASVQDILASVKKKEETPIIEEPGPSIIDGPSSSKNLRSSTTDKEYTVIFDDDDPLPSSEDEDYQPKYEGAVKIKVSRKKKRKKKSFSIFEDKELEALIEDSQYIIPVLETVPTNESKWWSSIGKLDVNLDLEKHREVSVQLPERPEFWIYMSEIPGRSMIYYEWFDQREDETPKDFAHRQKTGKADNVSYFHIKDISNVEFFKAFGIKQKILYLKLHKYYDFTGILELKICITSESLVTLTHPSDFKVRIPSEVKQVLNFCFDIENQIYEGNEKTESSDIDKLYDAVKEFHDSTEDDREERVMINPQHRSLIPKLRRYQAHAVRWMLEQERYKQNLDSDLMDEVQMLHPLYQEVTTHDGTVMYFSPTAGYLVEDKPLSQTNPPGGILADEMGLGKTVEVLACMLCNPRQDIPKPDYLEPIKVIDRKRKKRRRRTPSPIEFHIKDSREEDTDIIVVAKDHDYEKSKVCKRILTISSDEEEEVINISQVDGVDTDSSEGMKDDENDEDFVPQQPIVVKPRVQRRKTTNIKNRAYSDERTVYYHEDFDSLSDDDEFVPAQKRRKTVKTSTKNKTGKEKEAPKKAKVINTTQKHDESYPIYSPFKNGSFSGKSNNMYEQIVKTVHDLSEGKKATDGVSVKSVKSYLASHFKKDINHKTFAKKFSEFISLGVANGQFIRTSIGKGASGSLALNLHFNPNDTRAVYAFRDLTEENQTIEEVITNVCYDGKPFEFPHVPEIFQKNMEKIKERNSVKGELYNKLKTMYEMSLPVSLAFYASDKRSKAWNQDFFKTKVDQRSYFECICGGTEEGSPKVTYRVQCSECSTEQHAECVKYDITDPFRGAYVCPHCWVQKEKVKSGATLIVSPSSICFQWIEEIQKHVKNKDIKMLFYKGSKEMGYMQPRTLASYDIVVTTYEILASETSYVDLPHSNSSEGRRFRNPKRYMAMPSPIVCIQWWRICLDEAQMIESTTTKTAEMALRLSAVNRWCVTGTPIGKSVNDLHGLLLFLQIDPFWVETWWKLSIYEPYCYGNIEPILKVLRNILWRTCKKDVLNQIDIPGQKEEVHWLQFSPVEEHFYRRQHIDISRDVISRLRKYEKTMKLSTMDRKSLSTLLQPLLKLRQACCHPQAVRGQFISLQKSTMTMEELLDQLISKAAVEAEESHRLYIASLNGLAGIDIIQEKWPEAAEKYREVLRSATEHEGKIKTDTLQKLHTITNLFELIEAKHEGISPTMRDSELRKEAQVLKDYYMGKYFGGVTGAKDAVEPITDMVESCYGGFVNKTSWYEEVISWVEAADQENQIMKLVHDEMAQFFDVVSEKEFREIQQKYPNSRLVLYKIFEKLAELDKNRDVVKKEMKYLSETNPEEFLNKAIDCHLRVSTSSQKHKKKCDLCQVHDKIEILENTLFHFVKGEIKGSKGPNRASVTTDERKELEKAGVFLYDEQKRGTWSDSEAERLLRAVLKFAKQRQAIFIGPILDDGNNHVKLMESLKKEFRLTRIFWRQIFDNVAGVDELNMCTMRLRLKLTDEPVNGSNWFMRDSKKNDGPDLSTRVKEKAETIYILEKHELEPQKLKLIAEKYTCQAELRKKLGQLLYLQNLKTTDYGKRGGHNPESCPICVKELGTQWSVLQCGHCYCVECIRILIDEYSTGKSTKCAVCRSLTSHAEISYVSTKNEHEEEYAIEDVKGSHSTKVEAVLKSLVKIRSDDEDAKSLVFSTWPDVLDILAAALDENDIPYASLHNNAATTQNKFKRSIQRFKNRKDVKVLLMPISRGANGLNLVEASHVILIEPLLNPAQELQAIGRVHRIGQKKQTYVHRFLVKQTIEERIHQMLRNYHKEHQDLDQGSHSTEENLLTIQDLRNLFVDDETVEFQRIQQEQSNFGTNTNGCNEDTAEGLAASEPTGLEIDDVLLTNNFPTESNQDANDHNTMSNDSENEATFENEDIDTHSGVEAMIQESVISDILDRVNMSIG